MLARIKQFIVRVIAEDIAKRGRVYQSMKQHLEAK